MQKAIADHAAAGTTSALSALQTVRAICAFSQEPSAACGINSQKPEFVPKNKNKTIKGDFHKRKSPFLIAIRLSLRESSRGSG